MPHQAAGLRIDPPPSVPRASGASPAATAAPAPPDEPPGVWPRLHGLRVAPNTRLSVTPTQPSVGVLVLPSMMPPAAFMRADRGRILGRHVVAIERRAEGGPHVLA